MSKAIVCDMCGKIVTAKDSIHLAQKDEMFLAEIRWYKVGLFCCTEELDNFHICRECFERMRKEIRK